jgi:hypothetical protein
MAFHLKITPDFPCFAAPKKLGVSDALAKIKKKNQWQKLR